MIPVVEEYLSESIKSKLMYLRQNPTLVSQILNISEARAQRVQRYLSEIPITVLRGAYPRTNSELPCICIMLSKENEAQSNLGDISIEDNYTVVQREHTVTAIRLEDYYSLSLPIKPLEEVIQMIHVPTQAVIPSYFTSVESYERSLVCISPECDIVNTGDEIRVQYSVRGMSTESVEGLWEANYRLEVWANNGDLVVELYHMLKWILMASRSSLEGDKEIFNQKLSGGDFEPATNYFPEFVYRRSLNFWCQFIASAPVYEVPYISDVYVEQSILNDTGGGTNVNC